MRLDRRSEFLSSVSSLGMTVAGHATGIGGTRQLANGLSRLRLAQPIKHSAICVGTESAA